MPMSQAEGHYKVVDRQIGPVGGVALMVGTVIGISVFLLPGVLIGEAGPSIIVALLITAIPMGFSILMLLQLGGAMPVAGGIYVYASRLLGPIWGTIAIWLVIPAIWASLLFTAFGFAEFARVLVDVPGWLLMAGVLLLFMALNLRGITFVATLQLVMVSAIVLGFLAFIIPGLFQVQAASYTPMFPEGVTPFILAVVALYIPFQGYSMIVELGEELRDPVRNIPRVLIGGMVLAVVLSVALVTVFAGLDDYRALADLGDGGVAEATGEDLAGGLGVVVALAALLGGLTTLNALITSYSRTLMRAARDEVVPARLAEIHPTRGVPHWAIVALALPPVLLIPVSPGPVVLPVFLALIILFGGFLTALALWNLPKRYPEAYEVSFYRLPLPVLKIASVGSAVSSVVFWLAVAPQALPVVATIVALGVAGAVYHHLRVRRGPQREEDLEQLEEHEAEVAGVEEPPRQGFRLDLSGPPRPAARSIRSRGSSPGGPARGPQAGRSPSDRA
jgi:basic amino acid/polyamine antiporter, APA family